MPRWTLYAIIVLAALSIVLVPVQGDDYIVDDDDLTLQWADYNTIQDAINASTTDDNISVYAGTYHENIVVNQSVLMYGNGTDTVIDGTDSGDAVKISSNDVTLSGFWITNTSNGQDGVKINGHDLTLDNCTVLDNVYRGIYSFGNLRLSFVNCNVSAAGTGMWIGNGNDIDILGCEINDCTYGLDFNGGEESEIRNTTFWNCSIRYSGNTESDYNTNEIDNCTVNGKPIVFHKDSDNMTVTGTVGELILGVCQDITVHNLSASAGTIGVQIGYGDRVTLENVSVDSAYLGIDIQRSNDITVRNSNVTDFEYRGLQIGSSDDVAVVNLSAVTTDGGHGIHIYAGCTGVHISDSYFKTTGRGIYTYSDGCIFTNCTFDVGSQAIYINNADDCKILNNSISSSNVGIFMNVCDGTHIANNTIRDSVFNGIYLSSCVNSTVIHNEIFDNDGRGVYIIGGSENNVIHHNNFVNNGYSPQAFDQNGNNTWDDGIDEGNYWDDWDGNGTYEIAGGAGAEDRYPLADPADTDAPEKVPEFGLLLTISTMLFVMAFLRRRQE